MKYRRHREKEEEKAAPPKKHYNLRPRRVTKSKTHVNALPNELIGRVLGKVSVVGLLRAERVSPRWKGIARRLGWTQQQKLDRGNVLEEATARQIAQFTGKNLITLFDYVGQNLRELDLESFGPKNLKRFVRKIAKSLHLLPKLEKLNIKSFNLSDFMNFLPQSLHQIKISGGISIETLRALSDRCPMLEEVPFREVGEISLEDLVEFIGKFPRQKRLVMGSILLRPEKRGALAPIGQLRGLEELILWDCEGLDEDSLMAIVGGCPRLRSLLFDTRHLPEGTLFQLLPKFPKLTALMVGSVGGEFTDAVLEAIAQRGQLKKLFVNESNETGTLTDASIECLINQCKSLVALYLENCPRITGRSLEAVVAGIRRRHGWPPGTLPTDDHDPGIFHFASRRTGIDWDRAREKGSDNPWLAFEFDARKIFGLK